MKIEAIGPTTAIGYYRLRSAYGATVDAAIFPLDRTMSCFRLQIGGYPWGEYRSVPQAYEALKEYARTHP